MAGDGEMFWANRPVFAVENNRSQKMKKIVIVVDSFKGSMDSLEAGHAARRGIERVYGKEVEIVVKPVADGGEGTMRAVTAGLGGTYVTLKVTGPFGSEVEASYGIVAERGLAVMEMAEASGITLVGQSGLDPASATTYGVGEMILDAVKRGCRDFIMGIGGSATTDGGVGMLSALGYEFLDETGAPILPGAAFLDRIARIRSDKVPAVLRECRFRIACDVKNPLLGEQGAVYVYGPQKGVKEEERELYDRKMAHYAEKTRDFTGKDMRTKEGAGAAGGLGFALLSYLDAVLEPGISLVLGILEMEEEFRTADVVVTGEGRMDAQTAMGKVPVGIARLAKKYDCGVLAFVGGATRDAVECNGAGIDAFFPIVRGISTLEEAMLKDNAEANMEDTAEQVFRLVRMKNTL